MKIIYPILNILNIRCDGRDKTNSCISTVVASKRNDWVKWDKSNVKYIIGISNSYWCLHLGRTRNKAKKIRFQLKQIFCWVFYKPRKPLKYENIIQIITEWENISFSFPVPLLFPVYFRSPTAPAILSEMRTNGAT